MHQRFSAKRLDGLQRLRRRPRGAAGGLPRGAPATATSARTRPAGNGGGGGIGGSNVKPGDVTVPPTPISQDIAYIAVRKVKNLLTGMPPTDEDVALVTTSGAAGLQMLVVDLADERSVQEHVRGQDGRLLPQRLPADRASRRRRTSRSQLLPERRLRLRAGRRAPGGRRRVPAPGAEPPGQLREDRLAAGAGGAPVHRDADDEPVRDDDGAQEPLHPDRDAGGRAVQQRQLGAGLARSTTAATRSRSSRRSRRWCSATRRPPPATAPASSRTAAAARRWRRPTSRARR